MVNFFRIKEYIFPASSWNVVGSQVTLTSEHAINGEILRLVTTSNFTGSVAINDEWGNFGTALITSGTAGYTSTPFSNTTGSFVVNSPITLTCGSLSSGTGKIFGPFEVYYR